MYSYVSTFCSACTKDVIKTNLYWKLKTDAMNDNDKRNKNTWWLVLQKVLALKRESCDRNGRVIAAWFVQFVHAFFGPAFWQCLASLAQSAYRCSTLRFFAGLSSAAGQQRNWRRLRDAPLVAHLVDQIILQTLGAEKMRRCVEYVKVRIGESQ